MAVEALRFGDEAGPRPDLGQVAEGGKGKERLPVGEHRRTVGGDASL